MIIAGCGGMSKDILSFMPHGKTYFYDDFKTGMFENYKILGTIDDLCKTPVYNDIYLGIGSTGDNSQRNSIYDKLVRAGHKVSPLIFPSQICQNVKIGENAVIGLNSQIHHDCIIGDNCVLSPRVTLCGAVELSDNVFIGAGSIIVQGVKIGKNSVIGAGGVVIHNVPDNVTVAGNPARILKQH
jgi:acetyltransferase-like isoleucine patch superfamily enzyme